MKENVIAAADHAVDLLLQLGWVVNPRRGMKLPIKKKPLVLNQQKNARAIEI